HRGDDLPGHRPLHRQQRHQQHGPELEHATACGQRLLGTGRAAPPARILRSGPTRGPVVVPTLVPALTLILFLVRARVILGPALRWRRRRGVRWGVGVGHCTPRDGGWCHCPRRAWLHYAEVL